MSHYLELTQIVRFFLILFLITEGCDPCGSNQSSPALPRLRCPQRSNYRCACCCLHLIGPSCGGSASSSLPLQVTDHNQSFQAILIATDNVSEELKNTACTHVGQSQAIQTQLPTNGLIGASSRPWDSKHAPPAPHFKSVNFSSFCCFYGPCFSSIEKNRVDQTPDKLNFGAVTHTPVFPFYNKPFIL